MLRPRGDAGFTLVELLVAIVILGVIAVPLSNVVIGILRNDQATSDRLALSHDAQISASYFAQDVATLGMRDYAATPGAGSSLPFQPSVQLDAAYDAGGKTCGTAATPTAAVRVLSDAWDGSASPPAVATDIVAYYLAGAQLHRLKCSGGALSDVVLAHNVNTAITVDCGGPCDTATVPEQITVRFSVIRPNADSYPITLSGQRRQS